MTVVGLIAT